MSREIQKKEVIIVGSDHYNTLWLVRSLGFEGYAVTVIIVGGKNSFVSTSRFCSRSVIVDSINDVVPTLMSLSFVRRIVVIAAGDIYAKIIDENYEMLSSKYLLHNCKNKGGEIAYWMNKSSLLEKAKESGLTIPATVSLGPEEVLTERNFTFPCLIKPEVSALLSKDAFNVCKDITELKSALQEVFVSGKRVLVQELINVDYEVLIYGVRTNAGQLIMPGGLKKIHTCSSNNNMGMMSYGCLTRELEQHGISVDGIARLMESIDYHGVFSVEFMIANGKSYFLEMNLRNDGTVYCTTKAGVNIPAIWSITAEGLSIEDIPMRLKRDQTFCMNEVNYFKYTLLHQSLIKSFGEILRARAFSIFEIKDLRPVIAKLFIPLFAKSRVN